MTPEQAVAAEATSVSGGAWTVPIAVLVLAVAVVALTAPTWLGWLARWRNRVDERRRDRHDAARVDRRAQAAPRQEARR